MTINGGQPHAVANLRKVFGWSETPEGAQEMAGSIEKHPSWQLPRIVDRRQSA